MSNEEIKNKDEQLQQDAVETEAEVVGTDADIDWNQAADEIDEKEAKIAQLEAALLVSEERVKEQQDSVLRARAEVETCVAVASRKWIKHVNLR